MIRIYNAIFHPMIQLSSRLSILASSGEFFPQSCKQPLTILTGEITIQDAMSYALLNCNEP